MVRVLLILVPLLLAAVVVVAVRRVGNVVVRAETLRWIGFGIVAAFSALAGLMLIGETLTEPGGWTGIGLVAAWLVPFAGLVVLAFLRPALAVPVLAVASLVPVASGVWAMVDFEGHRAWQDDLGPIDLVVTLVIGAALAVVGLSRPRDAGWLMIIITLAPALLSIIGAGADRGFALSVSLITAPVMICGVLYLWAAHLGGRATPSVPGARLAPHH